MHCTDLLCLSWRSGTAKQCRAKIYQDAHFLVSQRVEKCRFHLANDGLDLSIPRVTWGDFGASFETPGVTWCCTFTRWILPTYTSSVILHRCSWYRFPPAFGTFALLPIFAGRQFVASNQATLATKPSDVMLQKGWTHSVHISAPVNFIEFLAYDGPSYLEIQLLPSAHPRLAGFVPI